MSDNPNTPGPITGTAVARPRLSQVVAGAMGRSTDTSTLITLARVAASEQMGKLDESASELDRVLYQAAIEHEATIALARLTKRSAAAFHMQAWNVFDQGTFLSIRLPEFDSEGELLMDDTNQPVTRRFGSWDEWYAEVQIASNMDDTIASAIRNSVKRLLPEVKSGRIKLSEINGETGEVTERVLTIEDVIGVDRSKLEVMMGAINKLLLQLVATGDTGCYTKMGIIIDKAQHVTKKELKAYLSQAGLRGERITQLHCFASDLHNGRKAYLFICGESEQHYLEGVMDGRLNLQMVDTGQIPVALWEAAG